MIKNLLKRPVEKNTEKKDKTNFLRVKVAKRTNSNIEKQF